MKYKFNNESNLLVVLVGCVLVAIVSGDIGAGSVPAALTLKEQSCCQDGDVLSLALHGCFNQSANATYKVVLNCTQHYFIYQDLEVEVHVDSRGALVDGNYDVDWADYCSATLLDGDDTQPAFMVCFNNDGYASSLSFYFSKGIMMLISVFFLAVTLYIYFLIPDLRETQDKVTSIAVICLMMFMLLLSVVQLRTSITYSSLCTVIAFLMYFFLISYFAWLNVVMANVWKLTVARQWKIKERAWYILNHIYANTVALTLTAMVYVYHSRNATFGEISCWFRTEREQSYFVYLPLSVMLSINIFLFVWTSYHLHTSGDDISPDRKKALRYKCMLYLRLFLLAGLIWIFEIISFHVEDGHLSRSWFWILIDSINCLHGVLIFFVLIVWRQRIKRELSGRRILCFRGPASWSQLKDDEQEQLADEDREYGKYDLIIK
ncbi:probable G-protein coupled receptor Mth-like 11 [Topomyia yanbarensis]|uniref:probable G-protein coupled receptor Mth-like 11 n=1 Tax=Topomyia yanbarensis TaxID=2498891 RepID=UPI00273CD9F9|nr:probable G-protein coupled receptor Mth-like 11 [Topomyia yanbarensis]XP_058812628.1 probable G-protein coupled receptor Mth-like 11 [Topomyia yanbarensis]XP_058812629.1 probable G-protein coupled receptor Mth-like 11 [Topomyia yanbarensis]XP_058812630.1 probable G-protein coupled receptor Mth-like 11 [Topomyia yanbarensis]XP_058812631.1 probable G-protein coupled receptor Mth-like 11 [Topomyia yanbarensis]XP_058812632.1 probable G-protein coupled receptor Mth-like 11 [Topomyia yanbarensis]